MVIQVSDQEHIQEIEEWLEDIERQLGIATHIVCQIGETQWALRNKDDITDLLSEEEIEKQYEELDKESRKWEPVLMALLAEREDLELMLAQLQDPEALQELLEARQETQAVFEEAYAEAEGAEALRVLMPTLEIVPSSPVAVETSTSSDTSLAGTGKQLLAKE